MPLRHATSLLLLALSTACGAGAAPPEAASGMGEGDCGRMTQRTVQLIGADPHAPACVKAEAEKDLDGLVKRLNEACQQEGAIPGDYFDCVMSSEGYGDVLRCKRAHDRPPPRRGPPPPPPKI